MVDLLGTITCNGNRGFAQTWLVGEGREFNIYNVWMSVFASSNVKLRYFNNTGAAALADLSACTPLVPFLCLACRPVDRNRPPLGQMMWISLEPISAPTLATLRIWPRYPSSLTRQDPLTT